MIAAQVKLQSGEYVTEYANDHIELFMVKLMPYAGQIEQLKTKPIRLRDMRQGREKRMEGTNQ
jgi:hypothetical protein